MLDQQPVFVVASPGSGAAVLFELLDRARETLRLSDKDIARLRRLALTPASGVSLSQVRALRRIYREASRGARRIVVSDLARIGLSIATAHAVWPQARFVYLHRNPGEHIAAAHGALNAGAHAWEASTWGALNALVALPPAAWCAVNYADLLQDANGEAQWLGHMLGLTWTTAHPAAGAALRRHRVAAALQHVHGRTVKTLPDALVELAQRAEALQQRHHPAWVAGDTAKARQRGTTRKTLERFQRAVVSSRVAAGLCLATALPQVARAASYQVVNLNDSGTGSLRDAITQANTNSGLDTITFDPNLSGTVTLTSGVLNISDSVNIDGNNAIVVDGNHASPAFYPYSQNPNSPIDVTIANLTIQNGHNANSGGAIDSNNANLAVENCVIQNNVAQVSGGGIYAGGSADANISIVSSVVQNNRALTGGGGGIALGGGNDSFSMISVAIIGNSAAGFGGGVEVTAGITTTGEIESSAVLDNNSATSGGGIYFQSTGDILIQNSNISGNRAQRNAAGLYARGLGVGGGNAIIDSSTFSNNIGDQGAALQTWHAETLRMTASTVVGNSALHSGSGGLLLGPLGGVALISDCTITGNSGPRTGGVAVQGNVIVESSTIAGNASTQGNGGGIFFYDGTSGNIHNSIIAGNTGTVAPNQVGGLTSGYAAISFSLVSDSNDVVANSNVTIVANTNNVLGQNPNLSPVGNYGGPTETLLPAPDSPVVNAGDPNQAGLPPYDQRGFTRVVQGTVDMGAVELQLCGSGNLETQAGCSGSTTGTTTGTTTSGTTAGTTTGGTTTSGTTTGTTTSGTTTSGTTTGTTTSGTTTAGTTNTTTSGTTTGGATSTTTGTTTSGTTATTSGGTTTGGTTTGGTTTGGTTTTTSGGTTTGGTTTAGSTAGTTTGGSKGSSGCAAAPTANNPFAGAGFVAAALGLLRRRRQRH